MNGREEYPADWKQNRDNAAVMQCFYWVVRMGIADLLQEGPMPVCDLSRLTLAREPSLLRILQVLARRKVFVEAEPGVFALTEEGEKMKRGHLRSDLSLAEDWRTVDGDKEWWPCVESVLFEEGWEWDTLLRPDL